MAFPPMICLRCPAFARRSRQHVIPENPPQGAYKRRPVAAVT